LLLQTTGGSSQINLLESKNPRLLSD
jgi:hypothetical protein